MCALSTRRLLVFLATLIPWWKIMLYNFTTEHGGRQQLSYDEASIFTKVLTVMLWSRLGEKLKSINHSAPYYLPPHPLNRHITPSLQKWKFVPDVSNMPLELWTDRQAYYYWLVRALLLMVLLLSSCGNNVVNAWYGIWNGSTDLPLKYLCYTIRKSLASWIIM